MGAWVTGHNMLGYLPEADTVAFETWKEAVASMVADAESYADTDDEMCDEMATEDWADDDFGSMRATVDATLTDDGPPDMPPAESHSWMMCIHDHNEWPIVFWVQWEITRDADEEI